MAARNRVSSHACTPPPVSIQKHTQVDIFKYTFHVQKQLPSLSDLPTGNRRPMHHQHYQDTVVTSGAIPRRLPLSRVRKGHFDPCILRLCDPRMRRQFAPKPEIRRPRCLFSLQLTTTSRVGIPLLVSSSIVRSR